MTKEEAIKYLSNLHKGKTLTIDELEAIDIAIHSLSVNIPAGLDEAARRYVTPPNALGIRTFKAGAEWMARKGWTFEAHKGSFGICFDGSIDELLDTLQYNDKLIVQIRKER